MQMWLKKWRIKTNETESKQVNFISRKEQCPQVHLNNNQISQLSSTKYLGFHMDSKMTWKTHTIKNGKT